jgi:hypothetical protein
MELVAMIGVDTYQLMVLLLMMDNNLHEDNRTSPKVMEQSKNKYSTIRLLVGLAAGLSLL